VPDSSEHNWHRPPPKDFATELFQHTVGTRDYSDAKANARQYLGDEVKTLVEVLDDLEGPNVLTTAALQNRVITLALLMLNQLQAKNIEAERAKR
jgi:hypothetical protein